MRNTTLWLLPFCLAATGCYIEHDDDPIVIVDPPPESTTIVEANIDTGEELDVEPGSGAGVFIEYEGDGWWHIFTSCDTTDERFACYWEVGARADEPIDEFVAEDLESDDSLYAPGRQTIVLRAFTSDTNDGLMFKTTPGAAIRLEAWLDGQPDPRFINWPGDGAIHRGAPSDPIDLVPTAP